ncbi:unnamed protein product [Trichobilharzia szidati]|nr:unnamed protein product [Trichobilharzia szidati]
MTLLPMENGESILCALKCFEQDKASVIPPILEEYIKQISKNGQTRIPWIYVKPLLLQKFNKVVDSFISEGSGMDYSPVITPPHLSELRQRVFSTLKKLDGIPFTIQRICELFDCPTRHYKRVDKFLRGLEKVCMVVSTVDPHGNKIHQEDPRFPSRAGLDECELLMDGPTISPPNSPSTENIRMHNTSKSSDEEGTEEEDDDEGEDNSSDASDERQSPKSDHNLKSTSLMNNSCASSWLFKAQNALNLPNTPPMPFRNASAPKARLTDHALTNTPLLTGLCGSLMSVYSNNDDDDDDDCEQLIRSSENKPTSSDSQINATNLSSAASNLCSESSESLDTLPTESNQEETSTSDSTQGCVTVENQIQDSSSSWCEGSRMPDLNVCTSEDLNSHYNSKLGEVCTSDLVISDAQSDLPIKGILLETSSIENNSPASQILRPIGQLEAFVQNLNSEVSSSVTSSPHSGSPKCAIDPCVQLNCPALGDETHQQESNVSSSSDTISPVVTGVRRPRSPETNFNDITDVATNRDTELTESPAKRRRLPSSDLTETIEPITDALVETSPQILTPSPSALNDSPPIIMCNPVSQTRDMDSGECVFETEESLVSDQPVVDSIPATDSTDLLTVVDISNQQNPEVDLETVAVSQTVPLINEDNESSVINSSNINSETGEEES